MKNCKNCIYEEDAKKLHEGRGVVWGSSEEHPCISCERLINVEKKDNYVKRTST